MPRCPVHLLDNPVWHAVSGPQSTLAEGGPLAARYLPEVAPFAALPDAPSPEAWMALRELVGGGRVAALFGAAVAAPDRWSEVFRIATVQMVGPDVEPVERSDTEVLAAADVPDMLALVERAQPGPFRARTVELGTYLGIRHVGALVAMAGERMRLPAHTEISAVCTDLAWRGRGLGGGLVRALVSRIRARGDVPFLHAAKDNVTAIRLYRTLGFTIRGEFEVIGLRAPE